jgi:ribosomal-protein-alanine N-acetyltransferase
MTLETERLILRPWREEDAADLYEYARDPLVGPAAGWPPHTDAEDSLNIIRGVLSAPETFAVTIKGDGRAVGSVGLKPPALPAPRDEPELGYWIGVPFWGRGYITEAAGGLLRYCFEEKGAGRVWCGHYEGNERSRRVIEKCGFRLMAKRRSRVPLLGETRAEYYYALAKEEWRG